MKKDKIYILLNHQPTSEQLDDLKQFLRNEIEVIEPSKEIKEIWSNIDPELDEKDRIQLASLIAKEIYKNECTVAWVQGEFATTYYLVRQLRENEVLCVVATSKRVAIEEKISDGSTKKTSIFKHCQFVALL